MRAVPYLAAAAETYLRPYVRRAVRAAASYAGSRTRTASSMRYTKKRPGPGYRTRGYHGRYRKRHRVRGPSKAHIHGSVSCSEFGGVVDSKTNAIDDSRVMYIGHCNMIRTELFRSFARAIMRKLFSLAEINFTGWLDPIAASTGGLFFRVKYYAKTTNFIATADTTPQSGNTVTGEEYGNSLLDLLVGLFPDRDTPQFAEFELWRDSPLGSSDPADSRMIASIPGSSLRVHVEMESKLSVQNRTLASVEQPVDPANPTEEEELALAEADKSTDIESNPLVGRRYMFTGNQGIERADTYNRKPGHLVASTENGLIAYKPTFVNDQLTRWHKPPPAHFIVNCTKSSKISLAPGQIKTSYLYTKKSMSLTQFLLIHSHGMRQMGVANSGPVPPASFDYIPVKVNYGVSEVLGFEKLVDTRQSKEPRIALGWEINNKTSVYVTFKNKISSATLMQVKTTPVPQPA